MRRQLFAVTSAATDLTLLSAQELRLAAGLTADDTSQDTALAVLGAAVAADLTTACNIAEDGVNPATLRSEAVSDTYWPINHRRADAIFLSRRFVSAVATVVEDGTTLTTSDYWLDAGAGMLNRVSSDIATRWSCQKIVVTYTAGFTTVPDDLKGAAKELIQTRLSEQSRDPLVKSVQTNIPDVEDKRVEYWVGTTPGAGDGVVPGSIMARLSRFINLHVG